MEKLEKNGEEIEANFGELDQRIAGNKLENTGMLTRIKALESGKVSGVSNEGDSISNATIQLIEEKV